VTSERFDGSAPEGRPPLPADLRRRVLVEAGHRCAIPTCRYIEVEVHHITPWAQCKAHEYENLIALCPNCHKRADGGQIDRKSLRLYKANLRFAHDKYSQLELDLLFQLYYVDRLPWFGFMLVFVRRLLDAELILFGELSGGYSFDRLDDISPDVIAISDKGRSFIDNLGTHEF
jgi:hypothetical protein